jgi:threonyl-tRNA synthetase
VLSISEKFNAYAQQAAEAIRQAGLRVDSDLDADKIGAKIRRATLAKVPYMLIVGEKEMQSRLVAVRSRVGKDYGAIPLMEFIERCQQEISTRGAAPAEA